MRVAVCLSILCSCAPVYVAPAFNVPLLRHGGEVAGAVHLGTSGIDVQGAYGLLEHVGVLGDFSVFKGTSQQHIYGDVGAGGFLPFASDVGRLEGYIGAGYGSSAGSGELPFTETRIDANGRYWRAFGQAAIGMGSDIIDAALVGRLAYVSYRYDDLPDRNDAAPVDNELFFEPAAVLRLGYRLVKGELQVGFDVPTTGASGPATQVLHVTLGLRGTLE